MLHGVEDRETAVNDAAGRVDVEHHLFVRVLALEEEKLRDDDVGDVIVDLGSEEHDAIFEEAAEDVPVALAAVGGLHDGGVRNERVRRISLLSLENVECLCARFRTFHAVFLEKFLLGGGGGLRLRRR